MDGGPRILVKISDRSLLLGKRAIEGRAERPYNLRRMGVEEAVAGGGSLGNFFFSSASIRSKHRRGGVLVRRRRRARPMFWA